MRLILLSGGSGKRLWPISNDSRSKQFLKVLRDGTGGLESMVQRVWNQLKVAGLDEGALIATDRSQVDILQSQLGESLKMVIEPERRDTYPAILLAATYLFSVEHVGPSEVIAIIPVDAFVEAPFFQCVKELEKVLLETDAELALVGVAPSYPSKMYGYIVPELNHGPAPSKVSHFQEKPSEEEARDLIGRQALWNCGVFAFRLKYIISKLGESGLPTDYSKLKSIYGLLPKTSFDYEVVEKARNIVAVSYHGKWKDLGSWETLTEELVSPVIGKGFLSQDSLNTHLINELEIPIIVLGLSDAVIAASQDGILVADKKESPKVKEQGARFIQRPMFEERRWGWYKVLDYMKYENGQEVLTKRVRITSGKNLSYQVHCRRSEVWNILIGEGEFAFEDEIFKCKPGDVLRIPVGIKHGIKANSDLEFVEVQTGTDLSEEDIFRIFMTWEEVEKHCRISPELVPDFQLGKIYIGNG